MNRQLRLQRICNPSRVAYFGGGGIESALDYLAANGFNGEVLVVNPNRDRIGHIKCVHSVAELPWVPDLAVLGVPKQSVGGIVRKLADIDCGGVICISSGFSESGAGAELQALLIEAAGEMPVIGPNCPGIANFLDGAVFMMDHFGIHRPSRGVAVISNGGAYLSDLGCADRSLPVAYLVGLGNQAMVSAADMLQVVLDDPRVTAVNLYFESIRDVETLSMAAAKAAEKGIPVVVLKGGSSAAGSRAAQSHTASLSGDAEVASALFERFGWIEVKTPSEAIETLKMLSFTAIPNGPRTGFVTSSGSYAVVGGDIAESLGLQMQSPGNEAALSLTDVLPAYVGPANPLDISDAHGWSKDDQLPIYQAFMQDDYDVAVQVMCYPPEGGWERSSWDATTSAFAEAAAGRPAAFVNTLAEALPRAARERMISEGVAPLQGMEDGLRAVAHASRYGTRRSELNPEDLLLVSPPDQATEFAQVNEADAKIELAAAGLRVPLQWRVQPGDDLQEITCQCVLKAIVPELQHKTEAGAVMLDLAPSELAGCISEMQNRLAMQSLLADEFLVEEMITGVVGELLVGLRRVPGIGVVLTLAMGGVAVELTSDATSVILPARRAQIEHALRSLPLFPMIAGYRGRPVADLKLILDNIEALAEFMTKRSVICELEINPLILTESDVVIVDALLTHTRKE